MASGVKALLEIVGGVVMVYFSSLFMSRYFTGDGNHWLWLVLGILAMALLGGVIFTVVLVKEPKAILIRHQSSLPAALLQTSREVLGNSDLVWFLVSRLFIYMAFTTIQQFTLYFLQDVIGVSDPAEATALFTIFAVVGMLVVVWPAGYLSDRIGRKPVIITSGLLGALGIAIIALSQEYGTILWAAGLIGTAMGAFNSSSWALATDLVPKNEEARYLGLINLATAGGAALARVIGPIIDFFNRINAGLGYQIMLLVCLAYFFTGAMVIFGIKSRR